MGRIAVAVVAPLVLVGAAAACSHGGAPDRAGSRLDVVAAENFWGSLASQLGGDRAQVTSVITSPATDPHDYEPTAADARAIAGAQIVIENGIGYDPWASKLVAAGPAHGRLVLSVGDLVGIQAGGNPHRWYSPANVRRVIGAIVRNYSKLDPKSAGYFQQREAALERRGLSRYERLIATIKRRYHGVSVGASESFFAPLAQALALNLLTPASFLKAISQGTDPTADDKTAIDRQIARKQIKVWIYNSQNSTPDVKRITDAARQRGIPVTEMTETLARATDSFQSWQSRQLQALAAALAKATGR